MDTPGQTVPLIRPPTAPDSSQLRNVGAMGGREGGKEDARLLPAAEEEAMPPGTAAADGANSGSVGCRGGERQFESIKDAQGEGRLPEMLPTSRGGKPGWKWMGRNPKQGGVYHPQTYTGELEKGPGEWLLGDFGAIRPSARALRGETTPSQQHFISFSAKI